MHHPQTHEDALAGLLVDLARDERLADDVTRAARVGDPEIARLPWEESRRHVDALLRAGFAAFTRDGEPDFAEADRFGAERAALGVPVAALLTGVHAGRSRVLEVAVSRGRAAGIPYDVMLHALLRLDRYGILLERRVVDAYRAAERDLGRDHREARIAVLRSLLLGEGREDTVADPARFGLRPGERYHCVVSDVADPAAARRLEQAFARCGGVLAPVAGRLSGLTPRLPADSPALTVCTPAVPVDQAPAAYALCLTTLRSVRDRGLTGLHSVVDLATETALAAQPLLATFLGEALLGALSPRDDFHRDLVATALAYLDHGQRLDRTADALHLHPNTVRYRLRRLQELTGLPDHPTVPETVRWWWALRSWPAETPEHRQRFMS
ncbi:PucR family transcriptional regulator [Nucisporomicrobium flavum]|uniref:PucR family transcriptional regulator n=1 Tax=Nucisporomicrobium flavum TaxID=2785915 RepID=UPI0027DE7060|nr:helix-turn-helix domain-containing protein [Nucisporomicrobium flavum]